MASDRIEQTTVAGNENPGLMAWLTNWLRPGQQHQPQQEKMTPDYVKGMPACFGSGTLEISGTGQRKTILTNPKDSSVNPSYAERNDPKLLKHLGLLDDSCKK